MKGIILCGGEGTRLRPITNATNKQLLPVYDKPMVHYPLEMMIRAGVKEVLCVVGAPFGGHIMALLSDGKALGLDSLTYAYQEKADGPGAALLLAEQFAAGEPVLVAMGDQVTDADISEAVYNYQGGAMVFVHEFRDPQGMGVPEFDAQDPGKIVAIEENPEHPKSPYTVTGIYIYDSSCFAALREEAEHVQGELKLTETNNRYIERGELRWAHLQGYWEDTGRFDRLYEASKYFAEKAGH